MYKTEQATVWGLHGFLLRRQERAILSFMGKVLCFIICSGWVQSLPSRSDFQVVHSFCPRRHLNIEGVESGWGIWTGKFFPLWMMFFTCENRTKAMPKRRLYFVHSQKSGEVNRRGCCTLGTYQHYLVIRAELLFLSLPRFLRSAQHAGMALVI